MSVSVADMSSSSNSKPDSSVSISASLHLGALRVALENTKTNCAVEMLIEDISLEQLDTLSAGIEAISDILRNSPPRALVRPTRILPDGDVEVVDSPSEASMFSVYMRVGPEEKWISDCSTLDFAQSLADAVNAG